VGAKGVRAAAMVHTSRRAQGDDSIYYDHRVGTECSDARHHKTCSGRWRGVISLGEGPDGRRLRRKVNGQTQPEVKDKLRALHEELREGLHTSRSYTVRRCVEDWLADGLDGRSAKTVSTYREVLGPLVALIGSAKLRDLSARQVRSALVKLSADRSTRTLQITLNALRRAIKLAEANDLVGRNVAALVSVPAGTAGRPSKSLTLEQAKSLIVSAKRSRLHGYIMLCLLTGCRTEEVRALSWDHVDLEGSPEAVPPIPPHVDVWRSVRSHGDVKTKKSRRTLRLPVAAVEALKSHRVTQSEERLKAGPLWAGHGLVFATQLGRPLDASHVRRTFKKLCEDAGIGADWTPRELRHTFVSIMGEQGVPVEEIAHLVGHSTTSTAETVYRKELRPVISTGAEVMDAVFKMS
jgi:integrase